MSRSTPSVARRLSPQDKLTESARSFTIHGAGGLVESLDLNLDDQSLLASVKELRRASLNNAVQPMVGGPLPAGCSPVVRKKLSQCLNTLVDLARIYGFDQSGFSAASTLEHWQLCSAECGWMKFLKYKLAAYFAQFLETPLPKKPFSRPDNPSILIGSTWGRFERVVRRSENAVSFATSILYSKKGMVRPDKSEVRQSELKTFETLTTERQCTPSRYLPREKVLDEIRRTCREVFRGRKITDRDLNRPMAPSVHANYTSARSAFGTLGTLMHTLLDVEGNTTEYILSDFDDQRVYIDGLVVAEESKSATDGARYQPSSELRALVELRYSELYQTARRLAMDEDAVVTLQGLPEALKVRTISKGPPLTYFVLHPVQKFLHNIMRTHRVFRLLGEPDVTEEILLSVFPKTADETTHGDKFHSIDYEAATDYLDPEISLCAVDAIASEIGLPPDLTILFRKALCGHKLMPPGYKPWRGAVDDVSLVGRDQKSGQLMGSIVSFIVLCIVNASVCRVSYELTTGVRVRLDQFPCLINGDDAVVMAPAFFDNVWSSVAASVGLIPSVGKCYVHDMYLNINSTSFICFPQEAEDAVVTFSRVPFVNMGLVNGLKRSGGKQDASDMFDIDRGLTVGAAHRELMRSCPQELRLKVHEVFLANNWDTLDSVAIPWYIPEELGGVGLEPLRNYLNLGGDVDDVILKGYMVTASGHVCGPSPMDVWLAWALEDKVHGAYRVVRVPTSQPVQARATWRGALPRAVEIVGEDVSYLDVAAYYLTPSIVAKSLEDKHRLQALRHNERVWRDLMNRVGPPGSSEPLFLNLPPAKQLGRKVSAP